MTSNTEEAVDMNANPVHIAHLMRVSRLNPRDRRATGGGPGGLDPCPFQQMNKSALFVVPSLYQRAFP